MVRVVCLLFLFLNSTLGDDLVVVSSSKSKWQTSRWKRGAELAPKHWIEIQADIRSRYLKFFTTRDVDKFYSVRKDFAKKDRQENLSHKIRSEELLVM